MRHPLRSLLYIEWILFAAIMASEVSNSGESIELKWFNMGIVVLLAVMGLQLPSDRKFSLRILYTIAQVIPILVAAYMQMRPVGLLYIIVVIRSYLLFGRQYRLWITGCIFVLYLMTMNLFPYRRQHPESRYPTGAISRNSRSVDCSNTPTVTGEESPLVTRRERDGFRWGFVFLFGGILLSLQLLVDRILAEKHAKEELAIANQRIRNYALKAEENGSLQERNRIAREIHDSLGHSLTALNLHLEMAVKLSQLQPEKSRAVLVEAKRLGSIALQDVRQSVSALRSDPFADRDLATAINKLADDFKFSNHVQPICNLQIPIDLPQSTNIIIYRIVQEALTNISKHAHASEVIIEIKTQSSAVELRITDNGRGFIPSHNTTGFGLQGMRERILSLQGQFEIISLPDRGCQIVVIIPV